MYTIFMLGIKKDGILVGNLLVCLFLKMHDVHNGINCEEKITI